MSKQKIKTTKQVRRELEASGTSIADFARQHDLCARTLYRVLDGTHKGRRGEAHRCAVALGLKAKVAAPSVNRSTTL